MLESCLRTLYLACSNGQTPKKAELNESELEILRQIKDLMSKNISVQKTEDEAIKELMRIGRYDLVADLVAQTTSRSITASP